MTVTYGPYTPVVSAGNFYFVSGQIGVDPSTGVADASVATQTIQALVNLDTALDKKGLRMEDVVKTTVFLKNIGDFAVFNDIYVQHFSDPRPARSCVEVANLPLVAGDVELLVEIEAIAYKESL